MAIGAEWLWNFIIVVIIENLTNIEGVIVILNLLQTLAAFEAPNLKKVFKEFPSSNEDT
jgi:hypothetical protein